MMYAISMIMMFLCPGLGVVVELSKGDKVKVVALGGSRFIWWGTIGNKHYYSSVGSGYLLK